MSYASGIKRSQQGRIDMKGDLREQTKCLANQDKFREIVRLIERIPENGRN
jgi:hypothetical protein